MNPTCKATMEIPAPGTGGYGSVELVCDRVVGHAGLHEDLGERIRWERM